MYVRTRDGLGQGQATWSTLLAEHSDFRSAEDRIYEDGFEAVLAVLAGVSPWQEYIRGNLHLARQNLPRRPFRIVSSKEFAETMKALGRGGDIAHTPGVTDKRAGIITMLEFFGVNSRATFLGAASTKPYTWSHTRRGEAGCRTARRGPSLERASLKVS